MINRTIVIPTGGTGCRILSKEVVLRKERPMRFILLDSKDDYVSRGQRYKSFSALFQLVQRLRDDYYNCDSAILSAYSRAVSPARKYEDKFNWLISLLQRMEIKKRDKTEIRKSVPKLCIQNNLFVEPLKEYIIQKIIGQKYKSQNNKYQNNILNTKAAFRKKYISGPIVMQQLFSKGNRVVASFFKIWSEYSQRLLHIITMLRYRNILKIPNKVFPLLT